jgi:DNA invertase Pin-like site-specific DNA recombinase
MTSAAIYARVSSARQKKDQTIGSQPAALRAHVVQNRLEMPEGWVFEDEGHSGTTLVRSALERLRNLAAQGCVDVVLCCSPDRLARKFAYQALLIEEIARAGVRIEFVNGPRGDSPEDQLLIQFQGIFAEYEEAQLAERYRRGKAYRARSVSVNVLGGAPFGYRYVRKTPEAGVRYEVIEQKAVLAAKMFRRYADDGATIADLARWLTSQGVPTRTGKHRWDRSVIWDMLRNPACQGRGVFGADYLDQVVWDRITGLLADPALIRAEIDRRLTQARTSDLVTRQRKQLELALAKAATSVTPMIEAYSEQLITIDELRARMPHLRAPEVNLRSRLDALDTGPPTGDAYLKLAGDLDGFLAQLRGSAATAGICERQWVLRLLVKDVLIGPERITIRHRIPVRERTSSGGGHQDNTDTEGDMLQS